MPLSLTPIPQYITGRYASQADLNDVFGSDNIATWSQLNNDCTGPDDNRIAQALAFADAAVNDALRGGPYALPLGAADGSIPLIVTNWAATIAGVWLFQSRGGRAGDADTDRYATILEVVYQQIAMAKAGTFRIDANRCAPSTADCPTLERERYH